MLTNLKSLKKMYELLGNDTIRAFALNLAEKLRIRKNILRIDTNCVCNIECIMCTNKPISNSTENIMPFEAYKTIIDKTAKTTRLLYLSCGYEPYMTPDFRKYLAYAKQKKFLLYLLLQMELY